MVVAVGEEVREGEGGGGREGDGVMCTCCLTAIHHIHILISLWREVERGWGRGDDSSVYVHNILSP